MRKLILCFIVFVSLTLIQSEVFSKTIKQQMAEIDKEVNRINKLTFEKFEVNTALSLFPVQQNHGDVWINYLVRFYRDKKTRKIRKISYSEGYPLAEESRYDLIEYFNEKEKLILVLFNDDRSDQDGTRSFGRIYFSHGRPIKKLSQKIGSSGTKKGKLIRKGFLPKTYFRTPPDAKTSLMKRIKEIINKVSNKKMIPVYQTILKNIRKSQFKGSYTFRMPKQFNTSVINDNNVILRSRPSTKSKVLRKLNVFNRIEILSVGKQERIGRWGKYHWYQVKMGEKKGWVFGAFLEPVEGK